IAAREGVDVFSSSQKQTHDDSTGRGALASSGGELRESSGDARTMAKNPKRLVVETTEHFVAKTTAVIHLGQHPVADHQHLNGAARTVSSVGAGAVPQERIEQRDRSRRRLNLKCRRSQEVRVLARYVLVTEALRGRQNP